MGNSGTSGKGAVGGLGTSGPVPAGDSSLVLAYVVTVLVTLGVLAALIHSGW